MARSHFGVGVGFLLCFALSNCRFASRQFASAAQQEPAQRNKVVDSWQRRQAATKSFDISWSGQFIQNPMTVATPEVAARLAKDEKQSADHAFGLKVRLAVDGQRRSHFRYDDMVYSLKEARFVQNSTTNVINSARSKQLYVPSKGKYPNLFIDYPEKGNQVLDVYFVTPIVLIYRPFDDGMSKLKATSLVETNLRGDFRGRPYIQVRHGEDIIWVDSERDFLPIRYFRKRDGQVVRTIEIEYKADADRGWVPSKYRDANNDHDYTTEQEIVVNSMNAELPETLFDVVAPEGAMVTDYTNNREVYIDLGDNKKRMVGKREFTGKNYEQIRDSAPVVPTRNRMWFFIGISGLAMIVFLFLRRNKVRKT